MGARPADLLRRDSCARGAGEGENDLRWSCGAVCAPPSPPPPLSMEGSRAGAVDGDMGDVTSSISSKKKERPPGGGGASPSNAEGPNPEGRRFLSCDLGWGRRHAGVGVGEARES